MLFLPHHDIFQRISIPFDRLNLFLTQVLDCQHLFRR
jgi:hypothetical protein